MHSHTGRLNSPNFPSQYGADQECEWQILVEPGYKVVATFIERFDLENSTQCQNDFVQVLHKSCCYAPTFTHGTYAAMNRLQSAYCIITLICWVIARPRSNHGIFF